MEEVAPSSKFVGHSTEIIRQSKINGPFTDTPLYVTSVHKYTKNINLRWFDGKKRLDSCQRSFLPSI